jgi:ABC-type branched-subunit amino acid transport system ATPase component/ABC-type branched-subunit amino acid transport system permease subunit
MLATEVLSQATLRFVLLGLATGSLTALVGLAIVITYRVSGVLNFAAGALGGVSAFACYSLRDDHGWPWALALGAGLAIGALSGLLTYGVMALLRRSSLLTRLIATLALFSAAQGAMVVVWGNEVNQPQPLLPDRVVTLAGELRIGQDRLILIVLALVLALGLRAIYSGTLFGLATAAVSESRRVAASAGWSTGRVELINFAIAGVLSALAAILLAPILTLNAAILSVAVLPALAAALVGRFSSFSVTVAAALGIGVIQNELSLFQPEIADALHVSAPSLTGLAQAVPLLLILVFTVMSGRVRPARGEIAARLPLPGTGTVSLLPLVAGLALAAYLLHDAHSYADAMTTTFGVAIIACSVVVVSGYAGQLSLCQYAIAGFGAWIAAKTVDALGTPFLAALVVGVVAATAVGLLVALPAIRTRGISLAVVTLALALMFNALIFTNASLTGGFEGIAVESPRLLAVDLDPVAHPDRYATMLLIALVLVALIVANLRRGRSGRRMIAVRSNERAAAALGINIVGVKLYAFGVGAGIAALGGVLLAFRQPNVQFGSFDVFGSVLLVQYAVIGGLGWVSGVIAGAISAPGALGARLTNDLFPHLDDVGAWLAIVAGLGVVHILRQAPDGMASLGSRALGSKIVHLRVPSRLPPVDEAPGPARQPSELAVYRISVSFGGVTAVDDVSFAVAPGEVVGLIGPNGAGKTTLLDVLTGFTKPTTGTVLLDGIDVSRWTPERRAQTGMARSWQAIELFEEMTVRDNLLVACDSRARRHYFLDLVRPGRQALTADVEAVVDDLGLRDTLDKRPSSLPHGVLRLIGIARAIVSRPSIVFLDEPAAGLDRVESRELAGVIRRIADRQGVGVVVVEHDMALILDICDRIVVLDFGRKIADGPPSAVQHDASVIRAYLGGPVEASATAEVPA